MNEDDAFGTSTHAIRCAALHGQDFVMKFLLTDGNADATLKDLAWLMALKVAVQI